MYSSSRGSVVGFIESALGDDVSITKKLELDSIAELNTELLEYELAEPVSHAPARMARPAKPSRGAARVVQ
jgi:hypothetical protein